VQSKYMKNTEKERREAERFDKSVSELYKDDSQLLIELIHWTKFETRQRIPNPYAYVIQSLGDLTGKTVLECGCGTGIFSVILVKRGAQCVDAFDISGNSVAIAKKRAAINDVEDRIHFKTLSIYEVDYPSEHFDFVVGMNILHHIDIEKVVKKIYNCLKIGGWLILTNLLVMFYGWKSCAFLFQWRLMKRTSLIGRRSLSTKMWTNLELVLKKSIILNFIFYLDLTESSSQQRC
jgi:2-polyprenyl-3-methyl-5-hydroxy-6-metoxy-1,4-benzoquinol methylase